jgi:phage host-nuclease inhibitor protein Gam
MAKKAAAAAVAEPTKPPSFVEEFGEYLRRAEAEVPVAIDTLQEKQSELREEYAARLAVIEAQIQPLNELYRQATGRYYLSVQQPLPSAKSETGGSTATRTRTRRSRDECIAEAQGIIKFVSESSTGRSGAEIKDRYPSITGSIKDYVKKYTGVELADNGQAKRAMRYMAS